MIVSYSPSSVTLKGLTVEREKNILITDHILVSILKMCYLLLIEDCDL